MMQNCSSSLVKLAGTAVVISLAVFTLPNNANAVLLSSASGTFLSFRDCRIADGVPSGSVNLQGDPVTCDDAVARAPDGSVITIRTGGEFDFGAAAPSGSDLYFTTADLGQARAQSLFGPVIGEPVLKAEASSTTDSRVGATAVALQRFDNTSDSLVTAIFGGELDYQLTGLNPASLESSGVQITIELFTIASNLVSIDTPFGIDSVFNLISGSGSLGGTQIALLNDSFNPTADGSYTFSNFTGPISIDPGDSLFVSVNLLAFAARGATVDAFSTYTTGFFEEDSDGNKIRIEDSSNPIIASLEAPRIVQQVPIPASLWLFVIGLAAIARCTLRVKTHKPK